MSSRPFYNQPQLFRAETNAEQLLHNRIDACDKAFQDSYQPGGLAVVSSAVMALENWILGEGVADEECLKELKRIDTEWNEKYEIIMQSYSKEVEEALTPDLVNQPRNAPPLKYYREKYIAMWSLCQRKKLLLKISNTADVD